MRIVNQGQKHPESNYSQTWHSSGLVLKHCSSVSFCCVCVGNTNTCTPTHIYTPRHTKNAQNGFCITQATFFGNPVHLQVLPWQPIIYPSDPRLVPMVRNRHNNATERLQKSQIALISIQRDQHTQKNSQHIKIQHILAIWPFSLHPPALLHAKHARSWEITHVTSD